MSASRKKTVTEHRIFLIATHANNRALSVQEKKKVKKKREKKKAKKRLDYVVFQRSQLSIVSVAFFFYSKYGCRKSVLVACTCHAIKNKIESTQ